MSTTIRQIHVPAAARALSALPHADYRDAFVVDVGPTHERTAEEWARAILEGAPATTRRKLTSGWSMIGLKLSSGRSVLGWSVRRSTDDFVLLGADSRIGMPAELLFVRRARSLLFSTFVQRQNPVARLVWARVEPVHGPIVRGLLEDARRRLA
jgi:hypothetical protein